MINTIELLLMQHLCQGIISVDVMQVCVVLKQTNKKKQCHMSLEKSVWSDHSVFHIPTQHIYFSGSEEPPWKS